MRFAHDDQSKHIAIAHTFYVPNLTLKKFKVRLPKIFRISYSNRINYILRVD